MSPSSVQSYEHCSLLL